MAETDDAAALATLLSEIRARSESMPIILLQDAGAKRKLSPDTQSLVLGTLHPGQNKGSTSLPQQAEIFRHNQQGSRAGVSSPELFRSLVGNSAPSAACAN